MKVELDSGYIYISTDLEKLTDISDRIPSSPKPFKDSTYLLLMSKVISEFPHQILFLIC